MPSLFEGKIKCELIVQQESENDFISFPKDIRVIGDMPTAKPKSSPVQFNIEIHANEIPVELLGFKGALTTDLQLFVPTEGPERVTGLMQIHNPSLAILNKLIALKELSINLNCNVSEMTDGLRKNTSINVLKLEGGVGRCNTIGCNRRGERRFSSRTLHA